MISVAEMSSFDELASLRVTWKEMWDATRDVSFLQSWEWLRSYWRLRGQGQTLRTLVISMNAKPVGIVPLVIRPVQTALGTARVLSWPLREHGLFYGPVGPNPSASLAAALKHVAGTRRDWNVIELGHIDEYGADRGRTVTAMQISGLTPRITARRQHPVVILDGSWDAYLGSRTVECRRNLHQATLLLERDGPVSFHRWRPGGQASGETMRHWDYYRCLEDIADSQRPRSGRPGGCDVELLKDLHPAAVDAGAVDFSLLTVAGRPAACACSYVAAGCLETQFLSAAEPLAAPAMTVLIGQMLRDSFMRGDGRWQFREADQSAVGPWANGAVTAVTCSYYAALSPAAALLKRRQNRAQATASTAAIVPSGRAASESLRVYAGD